jgi:hypothetical protein
MSFRCFDFRLLAVLVDPRGLPPVLLVAATVVLLIADNVVAVVIVDTVAVVDKALSPVSNEIGEELLLTGGQLAMEGNNWLGNNESSSIFFTAPLNCWRVISNELYRDRIFGRRPYAHQISLI